MPLKPGRLVRVDGCAMTNHQNEAPRRWVPGVEIESEEDYEQYTALLAKELLEECTPEHIAVVAAQHIMYADLLERSLAENRRLLSAKAAMGDARLELAEAKFEQLTKNFVPIMKAAIDAHSKHEKSKAGKARHKATDSGKEMALNDWELHGAEYSSRASFARQNHRKYNASSATTVERWIRAHEAGKKQ